MKASLREELLDATAELVATLGFRKLRVADVAEAAGVSRQTVYNEFGNKESLVQAMALRMTADFLTGISARMDQASTPVEAASAAVRFVLDHAADNRVIASALTGSDAEDLLPFLTTRGRPVFEAAIDVVRRHIHQRLPDLPEQRARLVAVTAVRLVVSHLLTPSGPAQQAAAEVTEVVAALLGPAATRPAPPAPLPEHPHPPKEQG
ncbi:transcriptional regulator, TetR family [Goodfellowiella coeruleoviolacea]|uniref:Transcriptional regulator, TetR family n=2 Tax=Goodfellowiella coeruleoviolacea TaxID=334858 RepID=A0AAE3GJC0_9PSEU|nr:transcriptional regulator, TetR family [Goodfellowiella coeruleoviolacea]